MSGREGFWDFSLRVYAIDEVAAACLALQERLGVDVNLLLYCCWLGHAGKALDTAGLERALALSDPWAQQVVRPLRAARSWMKTQDDLARHVSAAEYAALRGAIKAIELRAERLQQQALASIASPLDCEAFPVEDQLELMIDSLKGYFAKTELAIDAQATAMLGTILAAAAGADPLVAQEQLRLRPIKGQIQT